MVMPILRSEGIGWYAWELIIGINQFKSISGLLYPDGSAREASSVLAVIGIDGKPDDQGIPLQVPKQDLEPFNQNTIDLLEGMKTNRTTPENFRNRYALLGAQGEAATHSSDAKDLHRQREA